VRFYLGTHMVSWMSRIHVPLFVSRRRLFKMKNLPRARGRWKQDSSGFTELSLHGRWTVPPKQYAAETVRFDRDIGNMDAAAVQDWMCEPKVLAQTGLTVLDHQRRTIDSFKALSDLAPDINWMPVVQGVARADYLRHLDMYDDAGIDLQAREHRRGRRHHPRCGSARSPRALFRSQDRRCRSRRGRDRFVGLDGVGILGPAQRAAAGLHRAQELRQLHALRAALARQGDRIHGGIS